MSILVYGGSGSLGGTYVSKLKESGYKVYCVDLIVSSLADHTVAISGKDPVQDLEKVVEAYKDQVFDAIICAAGGWTGGDISEKPSDLFFNIERMWNMNTVSAIACGHLATTHLKEGGLLVFIGAKAALSGTPSMIGYGISKAAVHHLTASLSKNTKFTTVALLPVTLDTAQNRQAMPSSNFASWTPLEHIVDKTYEWLKNPDTRPKSGSLISVTTVEGKSEFKEEKVSY